MPELSEATETVEGEETMTLPETEETQAPEVDETPEDKPSVESKDEPAADATEEGSDEEAIVVPPPASPYDLPGDWYVIHSYSGYENKVKANLEKRVESMNMEDKIFQVEVPMEEEMEIKDGKKRLVKKKTFPGYVLVQMIMTDDSWYVVRNTPGVTGFVGSGSRPIPLLEEEMKIILGQVKREVTVPKIRVEVGQSVEVRDGPFEGFTGVVEEVHPDRGKVRVVVSMFGRDTPLELDFGQIQELH